MPLALLITIPQRLLLSALLQMPLEPKGQQVLLENSTSQVPTAAPCAATITLLRSYLLMLLVDGCNQGHTARP